MFYRQKINELCYMYRYVYGKMSRKLSVRRPSSSFSRIRLDRRLAPRFSSRLPGLPRRTDFACLFVVPISRSQLPRHRQSANFNNRNTARRSSLNHSVKGSNYSITACHNTSLASTPQHIVCAQLLPSYLLHRFICYYFL